jgi:hypothetical protein
MVHADKMVIHTTIVVVLLIALGLSYCFDYYPQSCSSFSCLFYCFFYSPWSSNRRAGVSISSARNIRTFELFCRTGAGEHSRLRAVRHKGVRENLLLRAVYREGARESQRRDQRTCRRTDWDHTGFLFRLSFRLELHQVPLRKRWLVSISRQGRA